MKRHLIPVLVTVLAVAAAAAVPAATARSGARWLPPADPAWPRLAEDRWARSLLPAFQVAMHKGDRGRVLVVGGDDGMAGAAIHTARSALAVGGSSASACS